jgi:hypothetical protein
MNDCLDDIIGVTRKDCPCLVGELTEEQLEALAVSKSGLWLDELQGALSLKTLASGKECGTMLEFMKDSIEQAKKETMDAVIVQISNTMTQSKDSFMGNIGRTEYSANLSVVGDYIGHRWRGQNSDGVAKIKKIYIHLNATIESELQIYRVVHGSDFGELVTTIPFTSAANTLTNIPIEDYIKLPMRYGNEIVDYYLVYDRKGALPKNNKIKCNCGGKEYLLDKFFYREGTALVDVDDFNNPTGYYDSAMGLIFEVDVRCDTTDFICREYEDDNVIAVVMAHAIRFKANEMLNEKIAGTDQINRYTMMSKEYVWGKRNAFRKEWQERVEWIAANIDLASTDCFICRENQMIFAGIMS